MNLKIDSNHKESTPREIKPLSTNFTKLSNTLKQFVGNLLTNCLSAFDHFVGFALKGLKTQRIESRTYWKLKQLC